jgi:transposase
MLDHKLEPKAARRIEVITGPGGRRRFSDHEKARIIEEALMPGAVVSAVARQNGLTPQQLFTWLRQDRRRTESGLAEPASFVPAVVERAVPAKPVRQTRLIPAGQGHGNPAGRRLCPHLLHPGGVPL